jgi:hypothetical protein
LRNPPAAIVAASPAPIETGHGFHFEPVTRRIAAPVPQRMMEASARTIEAVIIFMKGRILRERLAECRERP